MPPIVTVGPSGNQTFIVPATDPGGEALRFRLATAAEACDSSCADPNPPGLTINANSGQVNWDTTGRPQGLYMASVVIEVVVGGNVISSTQTSFLIRIGSQANNPPVFEPPSPDNGRQFTIPPGDATCFDLAASDADAGDTVELIPGALPPNATFNGTNGNPATGRFQFTPSNAQLGEDFLVNFTAQDNQNPPAADFRSYTIRVRAGAPQGPRCQDAPPPGDYSQYYAECTPLTEFNGIFVQGDNAPNTIIGSDGNDLLRGGGGEDTIDGLPGDDCINGQAGSDTMTGADGLDVILGEDGNDNATGGPGNDVIRLGNEADTATGDDGNDDITGDSGADTIAGNENNDLIKGFGDNDKITGDAGNDRVQGSGGKDNVNGNGGKDKVRGGTGNDKVKGEAGNDQVQSQGGKDKISGGTGKDNIRAGGGNDKVKAADGTKDKVKCGLGNDKATVDKKDVVSPDCNKVKIKK